MKILLINAVCKSGSTGKITYDLYAQGKADGLETAICYGRGKVLAEPNVFKFGLDWETYLHAALTRMTGLTGCYSFASTRRLLKFMDDFQPDVVHIHELHAYFINIKPVLRYLANHHIPVVHTLHCEFSYTGNCGHAMECERWKDDCGRCPHLHDYPKTLFFDRTRYMIREKRKLFAALERLIVVTPSKWLAERAKQSLFKARDVRVIPNGIDTEHIFYPRDFQHLKEKHGLTDEKIVLAVAPLLMSQLKGGRFVLKLADALKAENIKFILIGVEDLTEKFPPNVIALGRTEDQHELAAYYSMADCFVICSEKENFPTTCLEAFCCGTPVVGFDVGGTAETVPAPYGLFCAYQDIKQLAALTMDQLDSPPEGDLAEEGRARYSQRMMCNAYGQLYREIVRGSEGDATCMFY